MAKQSGGVWFAVLVCSAILVSQALASTDSGDVTALQDLFKGMHYPPELKGWRLDGDDPCGESWEGVSCSESSVIYLKLQGLNLSGYLNGELFNFFNLKQLFFIVQSTMEWRSLDTEKILKGAGALLPENRLPEEDEFGYSASDSDQ